jgi:hypothetical protein
MCWMVRLWPSLLDAVRVVQPETVLRWHRVGFRTYWRWKSRKRVGRPRIDRGLRDLIRRMSQENSLWGASRIHGLGFEVAQSTVSRYMLRGGRLPSQGWKTFLRNQSLGYAILPGFTRADRPVTNCHRSHPRGEDMSIGAVIVVRQIFWRGCPGKRLDDLPSQPFCRRMPGHLNP